MGFFDSVGSPININNSDIIYSDFIGDSQVLTLCASSLFVVHRST